MTGRAPSEKAQRAADGLMLFHPFKCAHMNARRVPCDESCETHRTALAIDALIAAARADAIEECLNISALCAACGGHRMEQVQIGEDESDVRGCTNCAGTGYTYDEFVPRQIRALAAAERMA